MFIKYVNNERYLETLIEKELSFATEVEKTKAIEDIKKTLKTTEYDFRSNMFTQGHDRYSYKHCNEVDSGNYQMAPSQESLETTNTLKLIKQLMESKSVKEKVGNLQSKPIVTGEESINEQATVVEEEAPLAQELNTEVVEEQVASSTPSNDADALSQAPKKKRLNKVVITSENSVAQQLEDKESYYYQKAIKNLTRKNGKFKMTDEEAATTLFDVVEKINKAHADKKHAKDVFEKDSVEAYILSNITKDMSKAATLEYLDKKQNQVEEVPFSFELPVDPDLDKQRDTYIEEEKALTEQVFANEREIKTLKMKQKRNADALVVIRGDFSYLEKKQKELENADKKIWDLDDEIKKRKELMKKAKTDEEKQSYKSQIESLESKQQKNWDVRAKRFEDKCKAEAELEKTLKLYGYEGKTLEEIIKITDSLQIDINELTSKNENLNKLIEEVQSKYQATFGHSV